MRTILLTILLAAALAATAFAQAGPGKTAPKKKPKPDTTRVATAKPQGADSSKAGDAESKADTTEAKKPAPPAKEKPKAKESAPAPEKKAPAKKPAAEEAPAKKAGEQQPPAGKPTTASPPISQKAVPKLAPSTHVPRAILCRGVANREPVGAYTGIATSSDTVYFFTEIVELAGATITHRWKHGDEVRAEVPITIGGPYWRVYSRKVIRPDWTGAWTVEVVDSAGKVLALQPFVYAPADTAAGR